MIESDTLGRALKQGITATILASLGVLSGCLDGGSVVVEGDFPIAYVERDVDATDMRKHLEQLQKKGDNMHYGALLVAACAGTWPQVRRCAFQNETNDRCACG